MGAMVSFMWDVDVITEHDVLVVWPKHFKPLPKGYAVFRIDGEGDYVAVAKNGVMSDGFHLRNTARCWCFAHSEGLYGVDLVLRTYGIKKTVAELAAFYRQKEASCH